MTPIKIIFQSRESLIVYSDSPIQFQESVFEMKPPEIMNVLFSDDANAEIPELQEVKLVLSSGSSILCHIAKKDVAKADFIEEITECQPSNLLVYTKLLREETALDERFTASKLVINNVPDLVVRVSLHKEFLKRKAAYVSAVEAMVDGVIRRLDT
jgi:hypothetical protein